MTIEEEFRFDVRIQDRMLKKGLVQEAELKQRLDGLSDLQEQAEALELEQPGLTPPDAADTAGDKEAP